MGLNMMASGATLHLPGQGSNVVSRPSLQNAGLCLASPFKSQTGEYPNRRFADAVCKEATGDDPVVLVQDYHFALAPRFIRERLPRAVIITFWHIPWPNSERFGIFPWRAEILEGLLGSSIVGFHTRLHCNNFVDSVDRYLEARIDRESMAVIQHGRPALVRAYPISLEWPCQWVASAQPVADCRKSVFAELGLAPNALLGVGVERADARDASLSGRVQCLSLGWTHAHGRSPHSPPSLGARPAGRRHSRPGECAEIQAIVGHTIDTNPTSSAFGDVG